MRFSKTCACEKSSRKYETPLKSKTDTQTGRIEKKHTRLPAGRFKKLQKRSKENAPFEKFYQKTPFPCPAGYFVRTFFRFEKQKNASKNAIKLPRTINYICCCGLHIQHPPDMRKTNPAAAGQEKVPATKGKAQETTPPARRRQGSRKTGRVMNKKKGKTMKYIK
ncbi:MAG TPA: hypothetical protein O0X39_07695 [Methanocorpusculum sp.]|nr:hypothetical protein [Methanocorpusculum sp.]